MAAAAFKALLNFVGANGTPFSYFCTVSDVNAAYYVYPDAGTDVVLPTNYGPFVTLKDITLSAAGTDTSTASIFIGGKDTGEKIVNATNLASNLTRQFMMSNMRIAAGSRLKILQNT